MTRFPRKTDGADERKWGGIWRTRLARKIAAVFIVSATIPLLAFAGLGYFEGGDRIRNKLESDLGRECRSTSMSIYERLLFLESELRLRDRPLKSHEGSKRFEEIREMSGAPDSWLTEMVPLPNDDQRLHLAEGLPWVTVRPESDGWPSVFMVLQIKSGRIRIGRIAHSWLWDFGDHLPAGQELAIYYRDRALFNSAPDSPLPKPLLDRGPVLGNRELLRWSDQFGAQVSSCRDLFLARFGTKTWRVVQTTPESVLMSPLLAFRDIFLWVGVLTLILVTALSIKLIDLILSPIHKLQLTVENIRNRNYKHRVQLDSRDEFQELGEAFNGMLDEISNRILESQLAATDLAVARDLAVDALRSQAVFVQNVSHEFRTPTTSIRSFSEILRDFTPEDPETRAEFLDIIIKETVKLEGLVEQVLSLTQLQVQNGLVEPESFDPAAGLSHEFALFEAPAARKGVSFSMQIDDDLPQIVGNEESIKQIWAALISNAVKFTPMGGHVEVRAKRDGMDLVVEVQDEGCGLAKSDMDRIFEPFSQITADSLTGKPQGAGLGLTIAARILQHHDGRIEVESDIGTGTCFRVYLPGFPVEQEVSLPTPV